MPEAIILLLDSHRGTNIPYDFIKEFNLDLFEGIERSDVDIIQEAPAHEWYWDAWASIIDQASYTDLSGNKFTLWQDGDLFLICDDLMTDEEYEDFFGEQRDG